ncbi:MAG: helix-turn-helix domain-containing protein [Actinomycetota bacterium]|nr:helix-turn-helix domain-containing protein [Actinomycetota bacterium]
MNGPDIGRNLLFIRRSRMWTQGRLAEESGVSPTTISGIENGKISRPHFGTLRKVAKALGVEPEELVSGRRPAADRGEALAPLSLGWAMSAREEEFEREVEEASLESLRALSRQLDEEQGRLEELYEEFPHNTEQRRFVKRQIRNVAAQSGSVGASIRFLKRRDT